MSSYTKVNFADVKDLAPDFGRAEIGEARFARTVLGAERIGVTNYVMHPGRRVGFGHRHGEVEEVYVVLSGSGRFKIDDEVFAIGRKDVVYCRPEAMREWEAGPDGLDMLAFGGHANDGDMTPGWWTD
jgi:quercetin dioxygenase-like cupin family protein